MQSSVGHPLRDEGDEEVKSGSDTKKRKHIWMIESSPYFELPTDFERYLPVGADRLRCKQSQGFDSNLHEGSEWESISECLSVSNRFGAKRIVISTAPYVGESSAGDGTLAKSHYLLREVRGKVRKCDAGKSTTEIRPEIGKRHGELVHARNLSFCPLVSLCGGRSFSILVWL